MWWNKKLFLVKSLSSCSHWSDLSCDLTGQIAWTSHTLLPATALFISVQCRLCGATWIWKSGSCTFFDATCIDICAWSHTDVLQVTPEVTLTCSFEIAQCQMKLHDLKDTVNVNEGCILNDRCCFGLLQCPGYIAYGHSILYFTQKSTASSNSITY